MTCRVPTGPLAPSAPQTPEKGSGEKEKEDKGTDVSILGSIRGLSTTQNRDIGSLILLLLLSGTFFWRLWC